MDLESAIKHAEEVAQENYGKATEYQYQCNELSKCLKCGDEHMQLAEWLRDYKRLLEQEPSVSENPNNCEMRDATLEERESIDKYIKSISKPTGVKFGALEQEPSGDLISRGEVLENAFKIYTHECGLLEVVGVATIKDLPSVKPQEPKIGQWIMRHRKVNTINYRTGEDVLTGEIHTVKELIRYETDEPYCACCGKRAEDISQDYCGYCGAKMVEPNMSEIPTSSKPEISSYYGLKSYVGKGTKNDRTGN